MSADAPTAPSRFEPYADRWLLLFMRAMALVYVYGAAVHVMNIAGVSGFDWFAAPLKWQVLDIVYLVVDAAVVIGVMARRRFAVLLFIAAALSQIVLYTALRGWILDVPPDFAFLPAEVGYLDRFVLFHAATLVIFVLLVVRRRFGWGDA